MAGNGPLDEDEVLFWKNLHYAEVLHFHAAATVAAGQYVVYIESAREHGPHSITAVEVTLGNDGFSVTLRDDGELSSATATFTV